MSSFTNRADENGFTASMEKLHENEKKVVDTAQRSGLNSQSAEADAESEWFIDK